MLNLKAIERLDPRLRSAIVGVDSQGDVGALHFVVKLIGKVKPTRRAEVWNHFERTLPRRLRDHVKRLHVAYDEVAAEQNEKEKSFGDWLRRVRSENEGPVPSV